MTDEQRRQNLLNIYKQRTGCSVARCVNPETDVNKIYGYLWCKMTSCPFSDNSNSGSGALS